MIVHLMVPGLSRAHLEAAWLPLDDDPPSVVADLVCTFPASIETVEATLLTGTEPAVHGRWAPGGIMSAPWLDDDERIAHRRDDRLALARTADPADSATIRAALAEIAALVSTARADADAVIVTGGPAYAATPRRVDAPAGFVALGGMAVSEDEITSADRDALLGTDGVARVLLGDGLRTWHGPPVGAVAVAEPGWTFAPGASACGRRDLDGTPDGAVVLAWGPEPGSWPRAVHDVRIAPTLAAHAGTTAQDAVDRALRWS